MLPTFSPAHRDMISHKAVRRLARRSVRRRAGGFGHWRVWALISKKVSVFFPAKIATVFRSLFRVRDLTVKASRRLTFQLTVNFTLNDQM